jgi:hypothetical protein
MHAKGGDLLLFGASAVLLGSLFSARGLEQARSAPAGSVPQWQIAAGGKMKFDAASLKLNKIEGDSFYSNVDLGTSASALSGGDNYLPTGGLLSVRHGDLMSFMGVCLQTVRRSVWFGGPAVT